MRYVMLAIKVLVVAGGVVACAVMARRLGPWTAMVAWAVVTGLLCGGIALVVRRQAPGRITAANYLMGLILQWGYGVAKGKLPGIVAISWGIWLLLGAAAVIGATALSSPSVSPAVTVDVPADAQGRSTLVMTLLVIAWIVDGAALLKLIGILATGRTAESVRSLGPIVAVLLIMIVGSVALVTLNPSASAARTALLLAGGPPLLLGLGYGAFVLLIVTVGRNARWN